MKRLHRWIALTLALFFIVQGLTGSAITWMHELDVLLNPELLQIKSVGSGERIKISTLVAKFNPASLELPEKNDEAIIASYRAEKNITRQVMINPYTGEVMGERNWGEVGISRPLLMPTLFLLHRQLVAGEWGRTLVSINAILLIVVAVSGIYLWWPVWRPRAWWMAVTVSWKHFTFRLHRAAGFYCAPVFIVLAVTGMYFNKPHWIIPKVEKMAAPSVIIHPNLTLDEVLHLAEAKFPEARISKVNMAGGVYEIRLHQPGELRGGTGATRISIDANRGAIVKVQDPLVAEGWDSVVRYFFPLHSGQIFGTVGKIFISFFGLTPLLFAITGSIIWWRRRLSKRRT